jgi:hypothetical protein
MNFKGNGTLLYLGIHYFLVKLGIQWAMTMGKSKDHAQGAITTTKGDDHGSWLWPLDKSYIEHQVF